MDKPLLKRNLTSRERNQLYYDTAFEGLCLNSDDGFRIDFEQGKTASAAEESAPPPVNVKTDNLIYNLWTFGNTKILIRCKIHGVVRDPSSKYNQVWALLTTLSDLDPINDFNLILVLDEDGWNQNEIGDELRDWRCHGRGDH